MEVDNLIKELGKRLSKYKSTPITRKLNYKAIPTNNIGISRESAKEFNELIGLIHVIGFNRLQRTKSGGISIKKGNFRPPFYDVRVLKSCIELTIISRVMTRIQFRASWEGQEKDSIGGTQAFKEFVRVCKKHEINIEELAITNGKEVKETIEKAKINTEPRIAGHLIKGSVHHIDFHSAYMGAIAEAFPILKPAIIEIFDGRKEKAINKGILTHTFGYFQSSCCGYKYSHLSKAAVEGINRKLEELTLKIKESGGEILAYNTDGIWYQREEPYHGEGEGKGLFQWENDHVNCSIFFRSAGCYCYREFDKESNRYKDHAVARGKYRLDKYKPRDKWTMSDFINDKLGAVEEFEWDSESEQIVYGE